MGQSLGFGAMLLGAHVPTAGGPANAIGNGEDRACEVVQIFNQSPRMWKGRLYNEDELDAYRARLADSPVQDLVIHAIYLINCASEDPEIRTKALDALTRALQCGDQLGARGVVLHPGSALKSDIGEAIARAGEIIREALAESESCELHLENTAGSGATLGRSFHELAALFEAGGGDDRLRLCLDSCHLYASGFDIRTAEGLAQTLDQCVELVGVDKIGSLHVNDSKTPLGSNVDRHAPLGGGELGEEACAVFLSEPRFEGLPMIFEGPGTSGSQVELADMENMRRLREQGLAARA
jgi:deoxyribonuclease-4